ncbi:MAG: FecR domain-containing protein [Deltaproteobacteria bacterium]|nr:FecR domain-containing protein [Deltaproteobacteria bacterium]
MTNKCKQLQNSIDWRYPRELPEPLLTHVASCSACQRYLQKWPLIERDVQEILRLPELEDDCAKQRSANKLVQRATSMQDHHRTHPRLQPALALLSIVLFSIGAGIFWRHTSSTNRNTPPSQSLSIRYLNGQSIVSTATLRVGESLASPPNAPKLLSVSGDKVGMSAKSALRLNRATEKERVFELQKGAVACHVAHRKRGVHFRIQIDDILVTVVGTRFSVHKQKDGASVAVNDGTVRVGLQGMRWSVHRGQRLTVKGSGRIRWDDVSAQEALQMKRLLGEIMETKIDDAPSTGDVVAMPVAFDEDDTGDADTESQAESGGIKAIAPKGASRAPNPAMNQWRSWILSGNLTQAENALTDYLRHAPKDRLAWTLLADCYRKAHKWNEAVSAYQKVIRLAPVVERRRAQYRAAAILQDNLGDHPGAVLLLEKYLSSAKKSDMLGAEARLRLARSYMHVGKRQRGKDMLNTVINNYTGTPAAAQAHRMLAKLK